MPNVVHKFEGNLHKVFVKKIGLTASLDANDPWLTDPIQIKCPSPLGATLIYDFDFVVNSIIEVTFDGDAETPVWSPIENGDQLKGLQSRFLRVLNDDVINFRAQTAGILRRIVVGEV